MAIEAAVVLVYPATLSIKTSSPTVPSELTNGLARLKEGYGVYKRIALLLMAILMLSGCNQPGSINDQESRRELQYSSSVLHAVSSTSKYVWVAGEGGIWKSEDGGESWTPQYRSDSPIEFLSFIDDQHGWAKTKETLLSTRNGGDLWEVVSKMPKNITDLHFVTPSTGYGVTKEGGGQLIASYDGGKTWTIVNTPDSVTNTCFSTPDTGWIIGSQKDAFYTTDGGKKWSRIDSLPAIELGGVPSFGHIMQITCLEDSTLFLLASYGGPGAGTDRWVVYELTPNTHISAKNDWRSSHVLAKPTRLLAINADTLFLVGESVGWLAIERTLEGRTQWQSGFVNGKSYQTEKSPSDKLIGIPVAGHFSSSNTGWLLIRSGLRTTLLFTDDGGKSWIPKSPPS